MTTRTELPDLPTPASLPVRRLPLARMAALSVGALGAAGLAALAWGSVERRLPVVRHFDIPVPRDVPEVRLLHIADLHLFAGQEFLLSFLHDVASSQDFDAVIATGDNFGSLHALDMVMEAYRPFLEYPGVFVLGSNDYYSPTPKRWTRYLSRSHAHPARVVPDLPYAPMVRTMRKSGWVDASNASGTLHVPGGSIAVLGTDDAHIHRDRYVAPHDEWLSGDALRLGVTHAPYTRVVSALTDAGSDLIAAGHTHGGQIGLPGVGALVTNCDIPRRYAKGLHQWLSPTGECSWLHVSAGLGTSPYAKVRIATRPEVSILHVHPAA